MNLLKYTINTLLGFMLLSSQLLAEDCSTLPLPHKTWCIADNTKHPEYNTTQWFKQEKPEFTNPYPILWVGKHASGETIKTIDDVKSFILTYSSHNPSDPNDTMAGIRYYAAGFLSPILFMYKNNPFKGYTHDMTPKLTLAQAFEKVQGYFAENRYAYEFHDIRIMPREGYGATPFYVFVVKVNKHEEKYIYVNGNKVEERVTEDNHGDSLYLM